MSKSTRTNFVLNQIETPVKENLALQQLAESEGTTKEALISDIITQYLKERKAPKLLPNFLDSNSRTFDLLSDIKQALITNSVKLDRINNLLEEMAELTLLPKKSSSILMEKRNLVMTQRTNITLNAQITKPLNTFYKRILNYMMES